MPNPTNGELSGLQLRNGKINTVERSHDTLEITAIYRGYKSRMGKTEPYPLEIIAAHPAANISFSPNWGKIGPVGENIEIPSSFFSGLH